MVATETLPACLSNILGLPAIRGRVEVSGHSWSASPCQNCIDDNGAYRIEWVEQIDVLNLFEDTRRYMHVTLCADCARSLIAVLARDVTVDEYNPIHIEVACGIEGVQ